LQANLVDCGQVEIFVRIEENCEKSSELVGSPGGSERSVPRVERRVRLPGLVVSSRCGTHLTAHASSRYKRGLRAYPGRVHGRHLMVAANAASAADADSVVVGQRRPAGRALHGH